MHSHMLQDNRLMHPHPLLNFVNHPLHIQRYRSQPPQPPQPPQPAQPAQPPQPPRAQLPQPLSPLPSMETRLPQAWEHSRCFRRMSFRAMLMRLRQKTMMKYARQTLSSGLPSPSPCPPITSRISSLHTFVATASSLTSCLSLWSSLLRIYLNSSYGRVTRTQTRTLERHQTALGAKPRPHNARSRSSPCDPR